MPVVLYVTRRIDAPRDAVLQAAAGPITVGFADPIDVSVVPPLARWRSVPDVVEDVVRVAAVRSADGGGSEVTLSAEYSDRIAYFGWIFGPLIRRSIRRGLVHIGDALEARALGRQPPPPPRRPLWAPPDRMTRDQTRAIATICAALAVAGYAGSLFTQAVDFIAGTYGATDADLGVVLATTRAGTLVGILGSVLADRRGRRRVILASTAALSIVTVLSSAAPSLFVFGALQVLSRGFLNLQAVVAFIAATEEAPEGARAYTLALASVASAAGFALGALLLPLADLGGQAWRGLFVLGGGGLLLLPGMARRLSETRRYAAMAGRIAGAKAREVVDRVYGRRFAVVAATGFLLNFLAAPSSQFMNRYLAQERGFSGLDILVLRFFTQGAPALVAVWIGGRLAESSGRKPVAGLATLVTAVATAAFFLVGGPGLWLALLAATAAGALAGPSLAAFNTELFPTEVRGTAGAGLLAVAVAGSAVGLLLAGYLAEPLGSVGAAVAVTAAGPIVVALLLIPRLPEARGMKLDEVSPPEV